MLKIKIATVMLAATIFCSCGHNFKVKKEELTNELSQDSTALRRREGIDVSHHQGVIDWVKVAENVESKDIGFVYIKATQGVDWVDSQFKNNLKGARLAKLKVGAYHYLTDKSSGEKQFNHFKSTVPRDEIDLIPMLDIEIDASKTKWTRKQVHEAVDEFIKGCIDYYGCLPIIYGTQRSYNTWMAPDYNKYHLMIGRYSKHSPKIIGKGSWSIWQYSETEMMEGIPCPVDFDLINDKYDLSDFLLK